MTISLTKPLDITGVSATNLISGEVHTLSAPALMRLIVPNLGAYFTDSLQVVQTVDAVDVVLTKGVQWVASELLVKPTLHIGKEIHCCVLIKDVTLTGDIKLSYQALGDNNNVDYRALIDAVDQFSQGSFADWNNLDHLSEFPVKVHKQDITDLYGLEYINQPLSNLAQAVSDVGSLLHVELLGSSLENSQSFIFNLLNDNPQQIVDTTHSLTDQAQSSLKSINRNNDDIGTQLSDILKKLSELTKRVGYLLRDQSFDRGSIAARQVYLAQLRYDESFMEVPKLLQGLVSWIDFSDTQATAESNGVLRVTDKADSTRQFTGVVDSLTINDSLLNSRVCDLTKQPTGLTLSAGTGIPIGKTHTVVAVYARADGVTTEKFTLLSDSANQNGFDVDINNYMQLGYRRGSTYHYKVNGVINDDHVKHACAASIHINEDMSLTQSSQPGDRNGALNKFEYPLTYPTTDVVMTKIGAPQANAVLAEVLVYSQPLSKYALDALSTYFSKKYNLRFNQITNGSFCAGLHGFESDYDASIDARNVSSIATIKRISLGTDAGGISNFYYLPNYAYILKMMSVDNKLLAVNTSKDITKAFWRVRLELIPHARYILKMSVYYNQQVPPIFELSINGQETIHTVPMDGIYSRNSDITFEVISTSRDTLLELRNVNAEGDTNTFAVDNIDLVMAFDDY